MEGIRGTKSSWSELVLRHREFLIKYVLPDFGLVEKLYADDVLSDEDKARINAENKVYDKNTKLLERIQATGKYEAFVGALKSSNQAHVVNYLEKDGGEGFVQKGSPTTVSTDVTEQLEPKPKKAKIVSDTCNDESISTRLGKRLKLQNNAYTVASFDLAESQESRQDTKENNSGNQLEDYGSVGDDMSEILKLITDENLIGKGSYGDVYGPFSSRDQTFAIKRIVFQANSLTDDKRQTLEEKRVLWTSQSHENLTKILTVSLVERSSMAVLYIFMEFLGGDTLRRTLDEHGSLPNNVLPDWAKQIANGMHYLHERKIVHRDLKSNNVLLTKRFDLSNVDDKITLKIGDFDEMREHYGTVTMTIMGTYGWMAPEVILQQRFSKSSDVWSYGVMVWEMLTGEVPHKDISLLELTQKAKSEELALLLPKSIPDSLTKLLKYCFRLENDNRPSFCAIKDRFRSSTTITRVTPGRDNILIIGLSVGPSITDEVLTINLQNPSKSYHVEEVPINMNIEATASVYKNTAYVVGLGTHADEIWKYESKSGWNRCASLIQGRRRQRSVRG